MDLVEVVLRAVNAERYLDTFRRYNINPECLKLLCEEDLEIMGIDNAILRKEIIDHCKALAIKVPEKISTIIDTGYVLEVLENIDKQLYFHYNNLILSAYRDDIVVYNIMLGAATGALEKRVNDLQKEINYLKPKVKPVKSKSQSKKLFLSVVSLGFILGLLIKIVRK